MKEIKKILIANRGVCACRIMKTCRKMNIDFATIFTSEDQLSLHVRNSKESYLVESYMDINAIIDAAKKCSASAIHPGYGFQSENYLFAEKCAEADIIFIGPEKESMKLLAQKHVSKELADKANLPPIPSSGLLNNVEDAVQWSNDVGYPCILKLSGAGGGMGIQLCENENLVREKFPRCSMLGVKLYGSSEMYAEKYIPKARHVEVQVFGDGKGNVIHLGERECSIQRRYQKVIEESPCPALTEELRERVCKMAVHLCKSVAYKSAGTVEFLFDEATNEFYFLEVNTRLQVEHRLTELCYGIDIVEWMISLACPFMKRDINLAALKPRGHAIECRIYAEDPTSGFKPSSGTITEVSLPTESSNCVVDTWVFGGCNVSSSFDPLLANVVQWSPTRSEAVRKLIETLGKTYIGGPYNNVDFVTDVVKSLNFILGNTHVEILKEHKYKPRCMEVVSPGLLTTVQDWPGRKDKGLWRIGVPPSGPMDHFACRVANCIVGNQESDAVLEITLSGPTLKFRCDTRIAMTGASMDITLDGLAIPMWETITVDAGSVLKIGSLNTGLGSRAYLSVEGGIDVPKYLGSRSTFPNGQLGGYQGRPLKAGDVVQFENLRTPLRSENNVIQVDAAKMRAEYREDWEIGVLPGPHANPEFLTDKDVQMFYSTEWEIGHNSNRLGIRLLGPAPEWARTDGGEGGSHPSNIHDCEYAVGTINFTGNMPIIITQDGPSLGGFVCPCTIVQSELWKIGQVKAGNTIRFRKMTIEEAVQARIEQNEFIRSLSSTQWIPKPVSLPARYPQTNAVLHKIPSSDVHPGADIRLAGDTHILIEYGKMVLDLNLRFRVHFLEQWLLKHEITGLEETAPGVRSLQVRYDSLKLPLPDLIEIILVADKELGDISNSSIPSRVMYLPMCFDYSGVDQAIEKYMKSVRPQAPYLPSNIEYIAQNNGLAGRQEVEEKMFAASYICLGLGDVYLGACCAVPVNPLHRMVTTKYNPARTFTQEGTVGLGGSYMCIYPMNSPGGYQLVGRTLPIWDTFAVTHPKLFSKEKPWMLEMFDQIHFYKVSEPELDKLRKEFTQGKLQIRVEKVDFSIVEYNVFLGSIAEETRKYRDIQSKAAAIMLKKEEKSLEELQKASFNYMKLSQQRLNEVHLGNEVPEGSVGVHSLVTGKVWEVFTFVGDQVTEEQVLLTVEAMKMECSSIAPCSGVVSKVLVKVGQLVNQGDLLIIIKKK